MTALSIGSPVTSYFSTLIFRSIALQSFSRILARVLCWKLGGAMLEAHPISPQHEWFSPLAPPYWAALVATFQMDCDVDLVTAAEGASD
jgi:hypothetical protein